MLDRDDFEYFRGQVRQRAGIELGDAKLSLVQARLHARAAQLGLDDLKSYRSYLATLPASHAEWETFVNRLTTNKTDWYREADHFEHLVATAVPQWIAEKRTCISVWCAACSTGEEAYTLSLVLSRALAGTGIAFEIFATDLDTQVLRVAENGVYRRDRAAAGVPKELWHTAFVEGREELAGWVRVREEIRRPVRFETFNLVSGTAVAHGPFDIVFCRNVFIYFERATVARVAESLFDAARPGALLYIGHAESLQGGRTRWKPLVPSVYQKSAAP